MTDSTEDKLMQLCDMCTSMSDWEMEFVDSCVKQVEAGRGLSEKQTSKIWDIYMKRMCGQ